MTNSQASGSQAGVPPTRPTFDASAQTAISITSHTALTISVEEAARMLGIGRSLAYESIRSGQFPVPVIKIGTRYLIPRAPLEALLRGETAA